MFPTPVEKTSKTNRFIYYSSVALVLLLWLVPLMIITLAAFKTADQLNAGGRGLSCLNHLLYMPSEQLLLMSPL